MTPENWERAQQIFEAALDRLASERRQFVSDACNGDAELESQIFGMLDADARQGGPLDRALFDAAHSFASESSTPQLAPGVIISARFEIVRHVGSGGMGQVYEARDLDLDMRIALKIIRPEIASNPEVLARFKREVRLTRRVTHPNVCRTFDLQRHVGDLGGGVGDVTFLTMEFLDGETLRDFLIRKRRLPPDEALPIIRQMADGLSAAHDLGIVHRDIKPSNAILVQNPNEPRTVITDFGLARFSLSRNHSESALSSLTGTSVGIGTLAYMAPEQLDGAEITAATDIYALGLVMYEMVTGSKAFSEHLPFGGIATRLKGPPPSPRLLAPGLSAEWEGAILRCLEPNPLARFNRARDIVEVISASPRSTANVQIPYLPSSSVLSGLWQRIAAQRSLRRSIVFLAVLAVALSLLAWILRSNRMKPEPYISPGSNILLTEIRNDTGEKYFDGVTELMRNQLAQSAHFNLADPNRVHNVLQQMIKNPDSDLAGATAREVALRMGARRVIFGAISKLGDSYVLDLVIEQPDNKPDRVRAQWDNHWSWREQAQSYQESGTIPAGLLDTVRKSSEWIRNQVGEASHDIAETDAPPQDVTTDKWDALSEFSTAERFASSQRREQALVALQNAVKVDPHFALAYMRMGDLLVSLGRSEEGYQAYGTALGEEQQRRLTRRERDLINGLRALDTSDFEAAESAFHDYTVYYPADYLGWFYRAYPLMKLGKVEEAIATLTRAEAIDPSRISAPAHIARCYLILGQYDDAAYWVGRLREAGHQDDADDIQGELAYLTGDYKEAAKLFDNLQKSSDPLYRTWSYALRARVDAEQGQFIQATQLLNDGIKVDLASGDSAHRADKLLDLAFIALKRGSYKECLVRSKQALALDSSPQRLIAAATLLGRAAQAAEENDRIAIVRQLKSMQTNTPSLELKPISQIVVHRLRGEELLASGRANAAVAEFKIASQLEAPANDREYLARAMLIRSRHQTSGAASLNDEEQALAECARAVSTPGQIWQWPLDYFPGYWSDRVFCFVQLTVRLNKFDAIAKSQLQSYLKRHAESDKGLADVEQAQKLLTQTQLVNNY
jgi:eukaryotic-like serine/threonine-protein kinase